MTKIICFGDSITHAVSFSEADRWPVILQYKLNEWKPETFKVYNRGIGGNTSAQGFDRLATDIIPLLSGIVLIEFGFNDATVREWASVPRVGLEEYKKNLKEFHRIITSYKGQCIFIVNHTIGKSNIKQGNNKTYNENFTPYNPAIKSVAEEVKAPIIDLPQIIKREKINLQHLVSAEDGLHLSIEGNHIYADMVYKALISLISFFPKCTEKSM